MGGGSQPTNTNRSPYEGNTNYFQKRQAIFSAPWCSSTTHLVNNQFVPYPYPTVSDTVGKSKALSTKIDGTNKPEEFLGMW
jgi:hypothetical protein